ncbi:hypothetical protein D3C71_1183990 [compost metagenome]
MVPFHGDCGGGLFGVPRRVGNHGHAARAAVVGRHFEHVFHAGQLLGGGCIKAGHLAAACGAHHETGVQQAGRVGVDAEHGRAIEFGRRLDARERLADQLELRGFFQRDLARHGLLRGQGGQFAKGGALPCGVFHPA